MGGVMFQYDVRVRKITWMPKKEIHYYSGWWHSFGTVKSAIEFCAKTSPYDGEVITALKEDWIIQLTIQDITLEELSPADWKSLMEPKWNHPDLEDKA